MTVYTIGTSGQKKRLVCMSTGVGGVSDTKRESLSDNGATREEAEEAAEDVADEGEISEEHIKYDGESNDKIADVAPLSKAGMEHTSP